MSEFKPDDFPLVARGSSVYRRSDNSLICTCPSTEAAMEIAVRLNQLAAAPSTEPEPGASS